MSDDNNLTEAEMRATKAEIEARDSAKDWSNAANLDFSGASVKLNESLDALKKVSALISAIMAESEAAGAEAKANADRFFAKSALKEQQANTSAYNEVVEKEETAFRVWVIADALLKKVKEDLKICWNNIPDSAWIDRTITDAKSARECWEIAMSNSIKAMRGLIEANEHLGGYAELLHNEAIERAYQK